MIKLTVRATVHCESCPASAPVELDLRAVGTYFGQPVHGTLLDLPIGWSRSGLHLGGARCVACTDLAQGARR